jgi:hypothetical protein
LARRPHSYKGTLCGTRKAPGRAEGPEQEISVKKRTLDKLTLFRETLRRLTEEEAKSAQGGSDLPSQDWTTGSRDSNPNCCA